MSDSIDRQAAIDALVAETIYTEEELKECYEENSHRDKWENGIYYAVETIKQLPSVQPKRGKWRHYEQMLKCSECGSEIYDEVTEYFGDDVPHFCPNCGADMRGEEE